ncbi:AraC family transcriptional regulator [Flavobacterium sp.]|uniref:AraC family transcriptional regulator n=1 Tax=Flavobacterium sp. TaxID=239 RepID=UPI0040479336
MKNKTQIDRYKTLIDFIHDNFKREITAKEIENICFYSYRNINRIFQAIHQESIGQYIKRIRIEKSAEYIKFTNSTIADVASIVGFNDLAVFSKAFKSRFEISPLKYRKKVIKVDIPFTYLDNHNFTLSNQEIDYEIVILPKYKILYLPYKGDYKDIKKIDTVWNKLLTYAEKNILLNDTTLFLAEIVDDNEITDTNNCRYNAAITIPEFEVFPQTGLYNVKMINQQKYAKFKHIGSHESSFETYTKIFSNWMTIINQELIDKPILEIYSNEENKKKFITDIYIPIK